MPHRTEIGFLFVSLVIQQSVAKFRNYTSKLWYRRDLTRFFRKIQICPVTCEIWRNFSAKIAPSVFGVFYFLPPFIFNLFFRNFISWCHQKLQLLCVIHIFENFVPVRHCTVLDRVAKEDAANFESAAFLWFTYVVNMSRIATFLGRFWIFG